MKSLFRFLNVLPRSKEEKLAQLTCELVNANNEAEKLRDEKEKISKSFKKLSVSYNLTTRRSMTRTPHREARTV